ncbi:Serine/threonine protein kinase [Parasponia andersonii]|uniref:Receptor-like serine/threonine-protein kinase n=1 Tax=Parasponia andersonii TaxID=3476 RepID=A0A2P5D7S8_PARAD|nr:Serine/threonine protein kinase [Parasponia andersonii]
MKIKIPPSASCPIVPAILKSSDASIESFPRTSYTYYLHSGLPSTWYNNNSVIYDGWKMRVLLSMKNNSLAFFCGFYSSTRRSEDYMFSVVAVGEDTTHTVVWSANPDSPVREDSSLQLSDKRLTLQDSNGTLVWTAYSIISTRSVTGMNLTEEGNLVLFGSDGEQLWQSFDNPVDTLLVGQRLYRGQTLTNDGTSAGLTEAANFSVFTNASDGRCLISYQSALNKNLRDSFGLQYGQDEKGEYVEKLSMSEKSYPLEFIECVKLDSDGRLKMYQYDSEENGSSNGPSNVDMITRKCETSRDIYYLTGVRDTMYFDPNNTDDAVKSLTTLSGCERFCLQLCTCSAALFSYENDVSDGICHISNDIVRVGSNPINQSKSLTFIKVLSVIGESNIPYVLPPTPSSSPFPPGESTPKALPPTLPSSRYRKILAAIISASIAGGLIMIILIILVSLVMLRKNELQKDGEDDLKQVPGMPLRFSLEELKIATENFKVTLGIGGFGSVFKGVLVDGTIIAVKRLDKMSQGMREFIAEVETIGKLHHFNLVTLVGFCAEKSCRLLVYEYMSKGSLDNWIFNRDQAHYLDWQTRKKIILDIAKGLAYLHEDCRQKIIHLDIKPHNILLDEHFSAKVSDFGLSKLIERDESQVLIPMRGTPGYLAPELQRSIVTVKVDVYSFGIVILEIVFKRRNVDRLRSESSFHLLEILQKKAEENCLIAIVEDLDEDMQNNREEVVRMIRIGAWCLQNDYTKRPLMSTVVKVLEGVMEVEPNISFKFSHAVASSSAANDHITVAPQASILSAPR